jgi:hypothetical protein
MTGSQHLWQLGVDGNIFNCTLKKQEVRVLTGFILRTDCSERECAASFYPVVAVVSHNVYYQMNGTSSNLYFMLKNVCKTLCTIMTNFSCCACLSF